MQYTADGAAAAAARLAAQDAEWEPALQQVELDSAEATCSGELLLLTDSAMQMRLRKMGIL